LGFFFGELDIDSAHTSAFSISKSFKLKPLYLSVWGPARVLYRTEYRMCQSFAWSSHSHSFSLPSSLQTMSDNIIVAAPADLNEGYTFDAVYEGSTVRNRLVHQNLT
jgi:hypothetical protein